MLPVLHIGPATIQTSILAFIVALWLGTLIAERGCKRRSIDTSHVWNISTIGIVVTVTFARLAFVAQNLPVYASDPAQVFALTPNALSFDYGVLFGLIAALAYIQRSKISIARFADALAPGALAAIALIAIGQFLSGDAFGAPTDLPWAISFFGESVHPVQLYDALCALVGLLIVSRFARPNTPDGMIALVSMAWYSAARVFVDAFRGDAALLGGGYRVSQVAALIVLLFALYGLAHLWSDEKESASYFLERRTR